MTGDEIKMIGGYQFSSTLKTLSIDTTVVNLSNREAQILEFLATHLNGIALRKDMITSVWGSYDAKKGRSLDVFISQLRKKLSLDKSIVIENIFSKGYTLAIKKPKTFKLFR